MAVSVMVLEAGDEAPVLAAVRASRALHRPWIDLPDSPERFAAHLEHVGHNDQRAYLLRHDPCGGLVGYVSLANIVYRSLCSAHLGYAAFAGHERRGLMTEGLSVLLALAFAELGLHRIEANIQPDNVASLALVRRLGFSREGYSPRYLRIDGAWRDHERWALLSDRQPASPGAAGATPQR